MEKPLKNSDAEWGVMYAEAWLESALAWAKKGNKTQTVASVKGYDKALEALLA